MDLDLCFTLVQPAPDGCESAAPLVLIHDGGGTSVNYYYLQSLDRAVYAIQNPCFYSGESWEDGISEMGETYAQLIRSHIAPGPILLGGWSLGGMVSLEIASIFSRKSSKLQVLGIVMIDSIYPFVPKPPSRTIVPHKLQFGKYTKPETQRLSANCMAQALEMVQNWTLPVWRGCSDKAAYSRRVDLENELSQKMKIKHPDVEREEYDAVPVGELAPSPQTILLRCNEMVPVSTPEDPTALCRVDVARDMEKLGWEQYEYDFISVVFQIPGHHFNIFSDEYLDDLTSRIKVAWVVYVGPSLPSSQNHILGIAKPKDIEYKWQIGKAIFPFILQQRPDYRDLALFQTAGAAKRSTVTSPPSWNSSSRTRNWRPRVRFQWLSYRGPRYLRECDIDKSTFSSVVMTEHYYFGEVLLTR